MLGASRLGGLPARPAPLVAPGWAGLGWVGASKHWPTCRVLKVARSQAGQITPAYLGKVPGGHPPRPGQRQISKVSHAARGPDAAEWLAWCLGTTKWSNGQRSAATIPPAALQPAMHKPLHAWCLVVDLTAHRYTFALLPRCQQTSQSQNSGHGDMTHRSIGNGCQIGCNSPPCSWHTLASHTTTSWPLASNKHAQAGPSHKSHQQRVESLLLSGRQTHSSSLVR